jgi:vancomycin resistance protein YoaR
MSRRALALGLIIVAAVVTGTVLWAMVEERLHAGRALPGVTIEGQEVGGLDARSLASRVRVLAAPALSRPVIIHAGAIESSSTPGHLGMRPAIDRVVSAALDVGRTGSLPTQLWQRILLIKHSIEVPITYTVDTAVTRASIARLVTSIVAEPVNAQVVVTNGRLVVSQPSRDGVLVDEQASVALVAAGLTAREKTIGLVVAIRPPAFSTDDAQRLTEPVAQFATRFPHNPDRVHNIRLAAASFRGMVLPPNAVLSYNRVVGPREAKRGYRKAPVIVNDILVPGDGGGVCQVSSTLFNAALLADMTVEARTNHSRPVPYLAAGRDATVSYGSLDLRVRNSSGDHLVFWSEVTSNTLTFTVFGPRRPGREVAIVVTNHTWISAPTHTVTKHDPLLAAGKVKVDSPKRGLRARTIRIVRQDGQVLREEQVAVNYYKPLPRTIRVGTRGAAREEGRAPRVRRATAP